MSAPQPKVIQQDQCSLVPDTVARATWKRVSTALSDADETLLGIASITVAGEHTRQELAEAAELIERATNILQRVSEREGPHFDEIERLAPYQIWEARP